MSPPAPFPRRINVELTNHCNQRCPLCPRQELTRPLGFMPLPLFEKVARECGRHDTKLWLHFLGEPLLHRHALRMIATAKAAAVREVGLSTNAVSLGTYAGAILASGLDRLECSIDADNAADYEIMRGRNHFERAVANASEFLERKRLAGRDRPITSIQFMRTPAVERVLEQIVEAWQPLLGPHDFVMTIEPASFGGHIAVPRHNSPKEARLPCRWLFESLVILQDGTVTMCGADWDATAPIGNVNETSIAEIWNGSELARRRAAHLKGDFGSVGPCANCEDWRLADGHGYVNASAEIAARRSGRGQRVELRENRVIPKVMDPQT